MFTPASRELPRQLPYYQVPCFQRTLLSIGGVGVVRLLEFLDLRGAILEETLLINHVETRGFEVLYSAIQLQIGEAVTCSTF